MKMWANMGMGRMSVFEVSVSFVCNRYYFYVISRWFLEGRGTFFPHLTPHESGYFYFMATFRELGLSEEILRGIEDLGFVEPMPIQEKVTPYRLGEGTEDLVALAQTDLVCRSYSWRTAVWTKSKHWYYLLRANFASKFPMTLRNLRSISREWRSYLFMEERASSPNLGNWTCLRRF